MNQRPRKPLVHLGCRLAILGLAAVGLGPVSLLVVLGETWRGRLAGAIALTSLLTILAGLRVAATFGRARVAWLAAMAAGVVAILVGSLIAERSRPKPSPGGPTGLQSVWFGPRGRDRAWPPDWIPEVDLVGLAGRLVGSLTRVWDGEHGGRIASVVPRLAREVAADPAGGGLPTVHHLAIAELVGRPFDAGHYYAYVPETRPGERLGAIVFLHGDGGNLAILPWAWREYAESRRLAIVSPTHGFGFWGEGGGEAVDQTLDDALARFPIDPARVDLAGISDGGVGVIRSAAAHPDRYRGLIAISPTLRLDDAGSEGLAKGWQGRPILVVQGDRDANVTKASVDRGVDRLRRSGLVVTYRIVPGEDHFLFFGRPAEVFGAIDAWRAGAIVLDSTPGGL